MNIPARIKKAATMHAKTKKQVTNLTTLIVKKFNIKNLFHRNGNFKGRSIRYISDIVFKINHLICDTTHYI